MLSEATHVFWQRRHVSTPPCVPCPAQGVLVTIREQLQSTVSFDIGDSALDTRRQSWRDLFVRMERLAALEEPWTLVIR